MNGWTEPQPDEISTIADGKVIADGAFVRTFWDWTSAEPDEVKVWCRVNGITILDKTATEEFVLWLEEQPDADQVIAVIGGQAIVLPKIYMATMPAQIGWVLTGKVGPVPGSTDSA